MKTGFRAGPERGSGSGASSPVDKRGFYRKNVRIMLLI
jgi:hypothetical protein